jgi:hypothetical protein
MVPRVLFLALLFGLIILIPPGGARVPLTAGGNTHIANAFSIDDPAKTYIMYGIIENASDAAYFRFSLNTGDQLDLSLTNAGPLDPVPDLVILSPGITGEAAQVTAGLEAPAGYDTLLVTGHAPATAEYEPFPPAATYEVASYSREIRNPGIYYVAIVSRKNETHYSFSSGYKEEFSPSEWVLMPASTIGTHIWEGQPVLSVLAPFMAIVFMSIIVIGRREQRKGSRPGPGFWLATVSGITYLGGAALTLVQMFRVFQITGVPPSAAITIFFAAVPVVLGIFTLRLARGPGPHSIRDRIALLLIGVIGLVFWAGLLIGPACALIAALVPGRREVDP